MKHVTEAIQQLKEKGVQIAIAIEALEHLNSFANANLRVGKKRVISASARRKMALAQKRRWAKVKAGKRG